LENALFFILLLFMKKNITNDSSGALGYIGLVFEFTGILAAPAIGGYFLDQYLENQNPWFFISGVLIGFVYGIWHLYRRANEINLDSAENQSGHKTSSLESRAGQVQKDLDSVGNRISGLKKKKNKTQSHS